MKPLLIYINKIDAMGGSVKAIEQDYIQQEIAASAYQYQTEVESGERVLVGVNKYKQPELPLKNVFKVDDSIRVHQIEKIKVLKARRDNIAVANSLQGLKRATEEGKNVMPFILTAVENYATLGEVANIFRDIFGEY
ncbi:methylmalonyl-CoA mutase family protein [Mucilaginibacter antarcticus]|uniref:methylmalonyl-CoA mutase family protein n=1 Tax=Mucilaginibacter antarcticus TaxID=1855725 RepID=UPI00363A9CC4